MRPRGRPAMVSVVIAAHNASSSIRETCESVLRQTYACLEIIVVDDGSTDDTADVVADLAASDRRIRLLQQQNLGTAAARNAGIRASRGEFIAPLDADDVWDPTKLDRQVQRLEEAAPTGLAYCWWAWIDVNGAVLDRSPRWRLEGRVFESLVEVNFTGSASVPLYRRSCIEELDGYTVGLREQGSQGCEDWDLALRVAERYAIGAVPAVLVGYRRRARSMSTDYDAMWRSHRQVMGALSARQPGLSPSVLQRSAGQFALHLAGVAFWSGDYGQACRWTLRARPLKLGLQVLPHVVPILSRRVLGLEPSRRTLSTRTGGFDSSSLREPLIPYDRIYARHWARRSTNGSGGALDA